MGSLSEQGTILARTGLLPNHDFLAVMRWFEFDLVSAAWILVRVVQVLGFMDWKKLAAPKSSSRKPPQLSSGVGLSCLIHYSQSLDVERLKST